VVSIYAAEAEYQQFSAKAISVAGDGRLLLFAICCVNFDLYSTFSLASPSFLFCTLADGLYDGSNLSVCFCSARPSTHHSSEKAKIILNLPSRPRITPKMKHRYRKQFHFSNKSLTPSLLLLLLPSHFSHSFLRKKSLGWGSRLTLLRSTQPKDKKKTTEWFD
jgi:hypothetical protein